MRTEKSIRNIKLGLVYQLSILLLNFISRKIFLDSLGPEYAGLNTLFNNVITMFSLAEMGVETAIIYNLYKPLADGDERQVAGLMRLYKRLYIIIGLVIAGIGVGFLIVLPYFVKSTTISSTEIYTAYGVFLVGTVLTYFTGYKRSLLCADQKNYILLAGDMIISTFGILLGIGVLLFKPYFVLYCITYISTKVFTSIWGSYKVDQIYPYLKKYREPLPKETIYNVKNNVRDLFIHKSSEFVVSSTDGLILSLFIGLEVVGRTGNYTLIIFGLMTVIAQIINGLQSSMGNLVVESTKEKVQEVFERFSFMMFLLASFCITSFLCLIQPFISVWIGEEYVLEIQFVVVMGLNFLLWMLTRTLWQQLTVTGLFKEDRINALLEMSINLVLSIVLVIKFGALGVFIGTTCSYLIVWFLKLRLIHQKFFKIKPWHCYGTMLGYLILSIIEAGIVYMGCTLLPPMPPIIQMAIRLGICLVVPNTINSLFFIRNKHFIYVRRLVKGLIIKMIEKLNAPKLKRWIQRLVFMVLIVLIFIIHLERAMDESLRIYGKLAAVGIFGITNLYILFKLFVDKSTSKKVKRYVFIYAGVGILLLIMSLITGKMIGFKASIMMLLVMNIGIACAMIDYRQLGKCLWVIDAGMIAFIAMLVRSYLTWDQSKTRFYQAIYDNSNYVGIFIVCMIFLLFLIFAVTNEEHYLLYILALIFPMSKSGARTAILALIAVLVGYICFWWIKKNKFIYMGYLVLVMSSIIGFTFVYPNLNELVHIEQIGKELTGVSNKSIFSGREWIWEESIEFFKKKPIVGYGMGTTLQELNNKELSTHNIYLQLLLQAGGVGLGIFFSTFLVLWKKLYAFREMKFTRVGASCLIGILTIGAFELTLLGQSISLGSIQWVVIGCSLSMLISNEHSEEVQDGKEIK